MRPHDSTRNGLTEAKGLVVRTPGRPYSRLFCVSCWASHKAGWWPGGRLATRTSSVMVRP
eukprot:2057348-Amphidinium_carterae.1